MVTWNNVYKATEQSEKPAPGWIFTEIIRDVAQHPGEVPEVAEYLMQCACTDSRTVSMKGCLVIRHLADEVPTFRQYMQQCHDALAILDDMGAPPQLAQAVALERPEARVAREAASRAAASCRSLITIDKQTDAANIKAKCQGFGNFEPPPEEGPRKGAGGVVDKVGGMIGDAVSDTVDDFREKGAVGALKDGVIDAADLLLDGIGAVWSVFGGRKAREKEQEQRICKPAGDMGGGFRPGAPAGLGGTPSYPGAAGSGFAPGPPGSGFAPTPGYAPAPNAPPANPYLAAFGGGAMGATHQFNMAGLEQPAASYPQAGLAAPAAAPAAQEPPPPAVDLLSFEDAPAAAAPTVDLLGFDDGPAAPAPAPGGADADLLGFGR